MILKTLFCVPTYNNPKTIVEVIEDALRLTKLPILIVDDGSEIKVIDLLSVKLESRLEKLIQAGRIQFLRWDINQGKGYALQQAFKYAIAKGYTHLISCDGDGQHIIGEIPKMLAAAKDNPWDLIIGHRQMAFSTVPGLSKFRRTFSNFWVQFQTASPISDSKSGFRIYPLFHIQDLKFRTRRFDFEIEVLLKLLWKDVELKQVDVEVHYPPNGERVRHFNKFSDKIYISLLNTGFATMSLLKSQRSPAKNGTAVGLGILIGTTPFFGLHTLIAAIFSFLFRLNFTYIFLGTNIAFPPIAPFIMFGSLVVGRKTLEFFSIPQDFTWPAQNSFRELVRFGEKHFIAWLVGSLILGTFLGIIGGLATYFSSKRMGKRDKKPAWTGKMRGGTFGNGFFKLVLKHVGLNAGYFCLRFITPYFYFFAPSGRKALSQYWQTIAPKQNWLARQFQILKHYHKFGQILMDQVYQNYFTEPKFKAQSEGFENIIEGRASGNGCILMGSHMGGWDLAAALTETHQFREEVPVAEIYQTLSEGRTVGMMGDRPMTDRYLLVPFFAKLAAIDVTPFQVAAETGAKLVYTFGFKGTRKNYLFFASPVFTFSYDPLVARDLQCYAWACQYALRLEVEVRKFPDQWFNFFQFWSSLPIGVTAVSAGKGSHHLQEELDLPTSPEAQ